ncbi:type 4a pilus biogenesis protein PilO [Chitinimonas sp. BJB300]|uniref:type 4a pilus biogenesis protein PilO n=1 Tax=Chitinimonas sp. BJB300 TaxID=1559339 RepID=UPI000C0E81B3|nr:type 4a pilus biogenesis protein PilO [Chitinimonas sp. BJB300]PHV11984.1 pilus assembly protein PilO [Chitinimonas sp. BJB300]TSJ91427.1 pilus assembly protein PilO [Chitinimonas sp. BJB300]
MNMDELRNLDPKDIANWPASLQIGALVALIAAIVAAGYFLILADQNEELEQGRNREGELKQAFLDRKAKAINLDAYRQQLAEIQESFGALLKQLPSKAEMETLITEINQSGVGRGLQFELFRPAVTETKTAEFAERPIEIKIGGAYHDLAAFASDVSQLSRIVTLGSMQIALPTPGASSALSMQAVASTYRALDEEEAVDIRRTEAAAKKNKN